MDNPKTSDQNQVNPGQPGQSNIQPGDKSGLNPVSQGPLNLEGVPLSRTELSSSENKIPTETQSETQSDTEFSVPSEIQIPVESQDIVEKPTNVEVEKTPEVITQSKAPEVQEKSDQTQAVTQQVHQVSNLEDKVVDLRTGHEELHKVSAKDEITALADEEEKEFIEGVEHAHQGKP